MIRRSRVRISPAPTGRSHGQLLVTPVVWAYHTAPWCVLGFNASATARVISRRWNDEDEISFLVEETGVPGGNHRPTASNWWNFSHIDRFQSNNIYHKFQTYRGLNGIDRYCEQPAFSGRPRGVRGYPPQGFSLVRFKIPMDLPFQGPPPPLQEFLDPPLPLIVPALWSQWPLRYTASNVTQNPNIWRREGVELIHETKTEFTFISTWPPGAPTLTHKPNPLYEEAPVGQTPRPASTRAPSPVSTSNASCICRPIITSMLTCIASLPPIPPTHPSNQSVPRCFLIEQILVPSVSVCDLCCPQSGRQVPVGASRFHNTDISLWVRMYRRRYYTNGLIKYVWPNTRGTVRDSQSTRWGILKIRLWRAPWACLEWMPCYVRVYLM